MEDNITSEDVGNERIDHELIKDNDALLRVVVELASATEIGIDIETTGLSPISDDIRLVQLASPTNTYVIDLWQTDIELIRSVITGPATKIAHSATFELEFLYKKLGVMITPIFDTMLAAQVVEGLGYRPSLARICEEYLGQTIDKKEQLSDWSARDLTQSQLGYAAKDAEVLLPLHKKLVDQADALGLTKVIELENRLLQVVALMSTDGVEFDKHKWDGIAKRQLEKGQSLKLTLNSLVAEHCPSRAIQGNMFGDPSDIINWNSNQQKLAVLKEAGLEVEDVADGTLAKIRDKHPLVSTLSEYTKVNTRAKTFGVAWYEPKNDKRSALHEGRIHAEWMQIGARTARMSCSNPNLQSVPKDGEYRSCFKAANGKTLVKADYSQIELRIIAEIARDVRMKRAFIGNEDLHKATAQVVTGKEDINDITDEERQLAKAVNFGLIYGMGAPALAEYAAISYGVSLTEDEALKIHNRYFEAYVGIRAWHREQVDKEESRTILGRRYVFKDGGDYTARLNAPIQGTACDGLKAALVMLYDSPERAAFGVRIVITVHDEIVIEVDEDKAESAKTWLERCMIEGMQQFLKEVPVKVDLETIQTWKEF